MGLATYQRGCGCSCGGGCGRRRRCCGSAATGGGLTSHLEVGERDNAERQQDQDRETGRQQRGTRHLGGRGIERITGVRNAGQRWQQGLEESGGQRVGAGRLLAMYERTETLREDELLQHATNRKVFRFLWEKRGDETPLLMSLNCWS